MSVLFLGPLPPPVTGHSLACQVFFDELVKHYPVEAINLNKAEFKQGVSSVGRIFEVLGMIWRIWRRRNSCETLYFTISESVAGNCKDLMIYLACFPRLGRMAIHLHGGAGMTRLMRGRIRIMRNLNRFFLRRLGAVIVLGPRHAGIFAGSVAPERVHTVANFAEDHMFSDPQSIDRKFARMHPLRVLFLSNMLPGKGHLELVAAFRRLDDCARGAVQLDFAGGFESPSQEREFLESTHGLPQVRYHGTVHGPEKVNLFANAHIFCLPTYYAYEGQPISILEAYASGCAVITTDHSGILDVFRDGVNGLQVGKESVPDLQAVLQRIIADPRPLHAMAMGNFRLAGQHYRTSTHTSELVRIMRYLHGQGSATGGSER